MPEELKTINFDFIKNQFMINGKSIGESVDEFVLEFNLGVWSLGIRERKEYLASGKAVSGDTADKAMG